MDRDGMMKVLVFETDWYLESEGMHLGRLDDEALVMELWVPEEFTIEDIDTEVHRVCGG